MNFMNQCLQNIKDMNEKDANMTIFQKDDPKICDLMKFKFMIQCLQNIKDSDKKVANMTDKSDKSAASAIPRTSSTPAIAYTIPAGFSVASNDSGPAAGALVERFGRRGTEQNELFRSEFGQNSCKIQEFSLLVENSKNSEIFNI